MSIEAESAAASVEFQGKTYYFCSDRCGRRFEEHPGWYVPIRDEGDEPGDSGHHQHEH